jgi:hypothetical protein
MVEDGEERGQEETKEKKRARVDVWHTRVLSQQHASYHRSEVFESTSNHGMPAARSGNVDVLYIVYHYVY